MTAINGFIGVVKNEIMANAPKHLEPRWPAILALLAVGGLRLALPESLSAGPGWLLLAVVGLLLIPTVWSHQRGLDTLNKVLGYVVTGVVTTDMIWSLYLLVAALPSHKEAPQKARELMVKPAYDFVLSEQERVNQNGDPKLMARYKAFRKYFESRLALWGLEARPE